MVRRRGMRRSSRTPPAAAAPAGRAAAAAAGRAEPGDRVDSGRAELAAALLAAERADPDPPGRRARRTDEALDRLRAATRQAQPVRVAYVNADGRPTEREVAPLDLAAGAVRAVDRASAQVITIPLARISAVAPA